MKPPTNLWLDLFKIAMNRILPSATVPLDEEEIQSVVTESAAVADAACVEVEKRMEYFKAMSPPRPSVTVTSMTEEDVKKHDAEFDEQGNPLR